MNEETIDLVAYEAEMRAILATMGEQAQVSDNQLLQAQARTAEPRIVLSLWIAEERNRQTDGGLVFAAFCSVVMGVIEDFAGIEAAEELVLAMEPVLLTMHRQHLETMADDDGSAIHQEMTIPTQKVS